MRQEIWVMPEKKDEDFSLVLIERVYKIAKSLKVDAMTLEISEQYDDEETPHFHMKVGWGPCIDLSSNEMKVNYTASEDNGTHSGEIQHSGEIHIEFCADSPCPVGAILTTIAFGLYDEAIREFYPEWTTDYDIENIEMESGGTIQI